MKFDIDIKYTLDIPEKTSKKVLDEAVRLLIECGLSAVDTVGDYDLENEKTYDILGNLYFEDNYKINIDKKNGKISGKIELLPCEDDD